MIALTALLALPLAGVLAAVAAPRHGPRIAGGVVAGMGVALVFLVARMAGGGVVRVTPGGWGAPLGIVLEADGLAVAFAVLALAVMAGVCAIAAALRGLAAPFWPLAMLA